MRGNSSRLSNTHERKWRPPPSLPRARVDPSLGRQFWKELGKDFSTAAVLRAPAVAQTKSHAAHVASQTRYREPDALPPKVEHLHSKPPRSECSTAPNSAGPSPRTTGRSCSVAISKVFSERFRPQSTRRHTRELSAPNSPPLRRTRRSTNRAPRRTRDKCRPNRSA